MILPLTAKAELIGDPVENRIRSIAYLLQPWNIGYNKMEYETSYYRPVSLGYL